MLIVFLQVKKCTCSEKPQAFDARLACAAEIVNKNAIMLQQVALQLIANGWILKNDKRAG